MNSNQIRSKIRPNLECAQYDATSSHIAHLGFVSLRRDSIFYWHTLPLSHFRSLKSKNRLRCSAWRALDIEDFRCARDCTQYDSTSSHIVHIGLVSLGRDSIFFWHTLPLLHFRSLKSQNRLRCSAWRLRVHVQLRRMCECGKRRAHKEFHLGQNKRFIQTLLQWELLSGSWSDLVFWWPGRKSIKK